MPDDKDQSASNTGPPERPDRLPRLSSENKEEPNSEFSAQIEAARKVMRKYRETLQRLADS